MPKIDNVEESMADAPTEIDMEQISTWRWRIVVIGDGWVTEHPYFGPRWRAKRHIRRVYRAGHEA